MAFVVFNTKEAAIAMTRRRSTHIVWGVVPVKLELVSLPSNSASEPDKGGVGTSKSPRQTPIENRTQTFQSYSSCDPPVIFVTGVTLLRSSW